MYIINTSETDESYNIKIVETNSFIPLDPANSDYQRVLDDIIEQGADCFDGDIPTDLQTAANNKQFAQQVEAYKIATARLAQYVLSVGRAEVVESQATGEQVFNEETMEMDDVMADVVTVTAIDALDATVDVTTYDFDTDTSSTATVANPIIVKDDAERADAQTIIDNTPQSVKDQVNRI
jgi:hypothetical protein